MNAPFAFSFDATKVHGLVWGDETGDATAQGNTYEITSPTPPQRTVYLIGYSMVSDTAGGECKIGTYTLSTDTFTALYDVPATDLAAGGQVNKNGDLSIRMALSSDIVPCVKLASGATLVVSGDLTFYVPGASPSELSTAITAVSSTPNQLEEDGMVQLEEDDTYQLEE